MQFFAVEEEPIHHAGDTQCPECLENYPEACVCGGLIHAEDGAPEDEDDHAGPRTRCDQCRRSQEDVEEDLGREPA